MSCIGQGVGVKTAGAEGWASSLVRAPVQAEMPPSSTAARWPVTVSIHHRRAAIEPPESS